MGYISTNKCAGIVGYSCNNSELNRSINYIRQFLSCATTAFSKRYVHCLSCTHTHTHKRQAMYIWHKIVVHSRNYCSYGNRTRCSLCVADLHLTVNKYTQNTVPQKSNNAFSVVWLSSQKCFVNWGTSMWPENCLLLHNDSGCLINVCLLIKFSSGFICITEKS